MYGKFVHLLRFKKDVDMELRKVHSVFFSATGTTAKIVSAIAAGTGIRQRSVVNLIQSMDNPFRIPSDEVAIFGVPVYSGRVPEVARKSIEKITGDGAPAIVVCVYGNRDFDDALLELKEMVEKNGFYVLSAGAFVAQHSIFPNVAKGKPDDSDLQQAQAFGTKSVSLLEKGSMDVPLVVKGNHPYRAVGSIPLAPKTSKSCNSCGLCVKQCPVQAINPDNPKKIDKRKCIPCAHCISICPVHAKRFGGLLYKIASYKFAKKYSQIKEPYIAGLG